MQACEYASMRFVSRLAARVASTLSLRSLSIALGLLPTLAPLAKATVLSHSDSCRRNATVCVHAHNAKNQNNPQLCTVRSRSLSHNLQPCLCCAAAFSPYAGGELALSASAPCMPVGVVSAAAATVAAGSDSDKTDVVQLSLTTRSNSSSSSRAEQSTKFTVAVAREKNHKQKNSQ